MDSPKKTQLKENDGTFGTGGQWTNEFTLTIRSNGKVDVMQADENICLATNMKCKDMKTINREEKMNGDLELRILPFFSSFSSR